MLTVLVDKPWSPTCVSVLTVQRWRQHCESWLPRSPSWRRTSRMVCWRCWAISSWATTCVTLGPQGPQLEVLASSIISPVWLLVIHTVGLWSSCSLNETEGFDFCIIREYSQKKDTFLPPRPPQKTTPPPTTNHWGFFWSVWKVHLVYVCVVQRENEPFCGYKELIAFMGLWCLQNLCVCHSWWCVCVCSWWCVYVFPLCQKPSLNSFRSNLKTFLFPKLWTCHVFCSVTVRLYPFQVSRVFATLYSQNVCVCRCLCVCVCVYTCVLRVVSRDKILRFKNTYYYVCVPVMVCVCVCDLW